jgi:hypothetical protein
MIGLPYIYIYIIYSNMFAVYHHWCQGWRRVASWTSSESAWTTPWRRQEELRGGVEPGKMVVFCLPRESLELGSLSMKHMTDLTESGIAVMIRQEYGGVSGVANIFFGICLAKKIWSWFSNKDISHSTPFPIIFIIFPSFSHHFPTILGDAVPTLPPFSPPGLPGGWRQPCGPFLTAAGGDGLQLFGRAREAGAVESCWKVVGYHVQIVVNSDG